MSISNNVDPNASPRRATTPAPPVIDRTEQHQRSVRTLLTVIAWGTSIVAVAVVANAIGSFVLVGLLN